jgi:hypothetical protein
MKTLKWIVTLPVVKDPSKWQITIFGKKLIAIHPETKPIILQIKGATNETRKTLP